MPTTYDLGAASPAVESARRRLEARLGASGQTLPSGPVEGSEAERLRAARAAIEALQRARRAESAREPAVARTSTVPPVEPLPGPPVEPSPEPLPEPLPESAPLPPKAPREAPPEASPPDAVVSRVRPREPAPTPAERLGSLGRSTAARVALAGVAALALAALGFLGGRTAARPSAPVAAADVGPASVAAPGPASGPAPADAGLVRDNLDLQRELAALEDRVDALGGLLAPEAVAALAEADRELELIELGGADPGANPVDVERVRARVRGELAEALGPAALTTLGEARDER